MNVRRFTDFPLHRLWIPAWISFVLVLFCFALQSEPTGYLHSWNQITTLAGVKAIHFDSAHILAPKDVTTLLSWERTGSAPSPADREERFTIFEEFPLYHAVSASLSNVFPITVAAKLVSIAFWAISLLGLWRLAARSQSALTRRFVVPIFCSSYPVLYYGQATMSDFAMLGTLIWAIVAMCAYSSAGRVRWLYSAAFVFAVSALFKSYAACFAALLLVPPSGLRPRWGHALLALAISCLPVLLWHGYALTNSGHQEIVSHSFDAKLSALGQAGFWYSWLKFALQFFGQIGAGLVVYLALKARRLSHHGHWWMLPWLALGALFLVLTADKVQHHNYYFLPLAPVLVIGAAEILAKGWDSAGERLRTAIVVGLILNAGLMVPKFLKAQRPNYDIAKCSAKIREVSAPHELIAVLSSNDRYNALQYYSERLGFAVQETNFPLQRYVASGASLLVLASNVARASEYQQWLKPQLQEATLVADVDHATDFKGKPRTCKIYRLTPAPPSPDTALWHLGR